MSYGSAIGIVLVLTGLVAHTEAPTSSQASIERVATLHTARAAHTATTLRNGQVLIAGGMGAGGGSLASAELLDGASNRVLQIGPMGEARAGHTATLLEDGRVLIAGGYSGEYLSSIELYDPATKRFVRRGQFAQGRSGHTATLLGDGRVLFTGGVGSGWTFLRSAELYDPASGRSELVGSLAEPRESHTATLLNDGRVLVTGGHNGRRQAMQVRASAELFDVRTRQFTPAGNLITGRHKHDAVRLADGRVLIIGGADRTDRNFFNATEIYSPRNGRFEAGPVMANRRYKIAGTSVLLANGDVLVPSGARCAELLDAKQLVFRSVSGTFPDAYHFATAAALPGGEVLIAGGYGDDNQTTGGVWRFR